MIEQHHRDELEEKGYTVVPGVLTEAECDKHILSYRQWLEESFPAGTWPQTMKSLIQKYRVGHMEPTWSVRLKAYPVFSQIWHTDKLLTSMDAIAIGRPPEDGEEEFWAPDQTWIHSDQTAERVGLHAYQGAVYLEHCEEDDWTFEVVEGSHKVYEEFMDKLQVVYCKRATSKDIEWFTEKGCIRKRVPCPRGGIVLWDSRLFHANARPIKGRNNPGRWRYVVFVCMAPAAWATPEDLKTKADAYNNLDITTHWPSTDVFCFTSRLKEGSVQAENLLETLPDLAKTDTVKRLVGLLPYENGEDKTDTSYVPIFNREKYKDMMETRQPPKENF